MEFTIEFYETSSGRCPVRDFLDDLKESDPNDFAAVMAGFAIKIAARDRKIALDRKRDWLGRFQA
jgi:hypothetical protein